MSAIIGQVLPFLSQEHQQQVATAVERAKQVTMADLSSAIGGAAAAGGQRPDIARLMQLHAQAQAGADVRRAGGQVAELAVEGIVNALFDAVIDAVGDFPEGFDFLRDHLQGTTGREGLHHFVGHVFL